MNPRGPNAPRTAPSTTSRPFLNARYALAQISPPHSRKSTEYAIYETLSEIRVTIAV